MKNKILITFFIVFAIAKPATALTPYLSAGVTSGFQNNGKHASTSYSSLWTITGGIQYALTKNISMRNGIEYSTSDYTFKNNAGDIDYEYDTRVQLYMANAVAQFNPTGFRSGVYAGISAGITNYKTELKRPYSEPSTERSAFTYGAMAGVSLNLIGGLYADLGVRYITNTDARNDGNLITTANLHMGF